MAANDEFPRGWTVSNRDSAVIAGGAPGITAVADSLSCYGVVVAGGTATVCELLINGQAVGSLYTSGTLGEQMTNIWTGKILGTVGASMVASLIVAAGTAGIDYIVVMTGHYI